MNILLISSVVLMSVAVSAFDPAINATLVLCSPTATTGTFRFENPDDILTVETPNYPGNYETGVRCKNFVQLGALKNTEYFLQVETTGPVDMAARIEKDGNGILRCREEYVKFRKVLKPGLMKPLNFSKVCATDELLDENVLLSSLNRLAIDFDTNNDGMAGDGAQFTITARTRDIVNMTICEFPDYTFTSALQELIIYSPDYPANYTANDRCVTQINLGDLFAAGYVLEIETVEPLNMQGRVEVDGKQKCALDFFKFRAVRKPGKTRSTGIKACGTDDLTGDKRMFSTKEFVSFIYETDATIQGEGWRLRITPVIPED